jgi:hypothetical protein
MPHLLENASALRAHILRTLHEKNTTTGLFPKGISGSTATSAVLLLVGQHCGQPSSFAEPCLLFNKRSARVKQPGDLCFPGGRITPRFDRYLSKLLTWPFFPLARWPHWRTWRRRRPLEARRLALLLAASLREGLEEMRLNPLGVTFLGPLSAQKLQMFDRVIYPMAGWMGRQKRFFPNWEVEKIVYIPIQDLLKADGYRCYRLKMGDRTPISTDFPCFLHQNGVEREVLWGATYRMTTLFLQLIFGFSPPPLQTLPVIAGTLDDTYLTGSGGSPAG